MREVKHMIKNLLKDQVAEELRSANNRSFLCITILTRRVDVCCRTHIQQQIRAEVSTQVRVNLSEQILDHLPATLPQLEQDTRKTTIEVKHALRNSYVDSGIGIYGQLFIVKQRCQKDQLYPAN